VLHFERRLVISAAEKCTVLSSEIFQKGSSPSHHASDGCDIAEIPSAHLTHSLQYLLLCTAEMMY